MDLVLPQVGSFRPVEGRSAPVLKDEVLSLTIKPAGPKPLSLPVEEVLETPVGREVLKRPHRFQAASSIVPAKPAPPVEQGAESLAEPDVPKHQRRFQALASAGPAKVVNRFSRRERTAAPAADPSLSKPPAAPEAPAESAPTGPRLQLPKAVLAALARAEAIPKNLPPVPPPIFDGTARKNKERRGVPPPLRERRASSESIYDW